MDFNIYRHIKLDLINIVKLIYFSRRESKWYVVFPERNVGKSLTLQTLAKAQGTDKAIHSLFQW
jgi:hypothetical protein